MERWLQGKAAMGLTDAADGASGLTLRQIDSHGFFPAFEILEPAGTDAPVVFSSPHSGSYYPEEFLAASRLDPLTLRRSEDAYVDELFLGATAAGAPLLRAHFPRAYLDVNREPYELDPRMFDGRLPLGSNTRSIRVAGGLGTIARIVGDAQEIYRERLPVTHAISRIDELYRPYHNTLRHLVDQTWRRFGMAVLVDCHSMPSGGVGGQASRPDESHRADFVIGDRYGTSCNPIFSAWLEEALAARGFVVRRNKPYAGGFITESYGAPAMGVHAIQVEVNRSLYMNESTLERHTGFAQLQSLLGEVAAAFVEFAALQNKMPGSAAAE